MRDVVERLGYEVELRVEGKAKFYAPRLPSEKGYAPTSLPVFYNPVSKPNRDMAILFAKTFFKDRRIRICEPLAGTGVRSIRLALETDVVDEVVANDISKKAYELMKLNIELNGVGEYVKPMNLEANELLSMCGRGRPRYNYVDIDPAGSPAKFMENGFRGCDRGGVLSATATDMSALTGAKPASCLRKYDVIVSKTPFSKEVALRILAGFMVRTAARLGLAAKPILSFQKDHYIKVFTAVDRGITKAKEQLKLIGWISCCHKCMRIYTARRSEKPVMRCVKCGVELSPIGPLWIGMLSDKHLVEKMYRCALNEQEIYRDVLKLLRYLSAEDSEIIGYYPVNYVAEVLKQSPVKPMRVIEELRAMGYRATVTHIDPSGFKTDAPPSTIVKLFKELKLKS